MGPLPMPGTCATISGMTTNTDTLIDCPFRPLTLGPVRRGSVQQPRFRYEGGTTSCRMVVHHLPDQDSHHRFQRLDSWVAAEAWDWDD